MGKPLVLCAVILACASIGSTLHCYKCDFTIFSLPCITYNVTCKEGEVCAIIDGLAVGHKLVKRKNCVEKSKCGTNSTESLGELTYTTTYNCCEGNACNSAPSLSSAHLSLSLVSAMLGIWLIRLL